MNRIVSAIYMKESIDSNVSFKNTVHTGVNR